MPLILLCTEFIQNHRVERMWVEVNQRVNYPIKRVLNGLVNSEQVNMNDEVTRFAISWVTFRVCHSGCIQVIDSWNSHAVPGEKNNSSSIIFVHVHKISVLMNIALYEVLYHSCDNATVCDGNYFAFKLRPFLPFSREDFTNTDKVIYFAEQPILHVFCYESVPHYFFVLEYRQRTSK